jgi:hypothetical protein
MTNRPIPLPNVPDSALLRAYRRGELDPAAEQAFEARLFFEPELVEQLELDAALEAALREQAAQPAVLQPVQAPAPVRRSTRLPWAVALAASLCAVALLPGAWRGMQLDQPGYGNVELVALDAVRSADAPVRIVQPRTQTRLLAIEAPAPAGAAEPFELRLLDPAGTPVITINDAIAIDGFVSVAVPTTRLRAGDEYRLEVRSAGQTSPASTLAFRFEPRE